MSFDSLNFQILSRQFARVCVFDLLFESDQLIDIQMSLFDALPALASALNLVKLLAPAGCAPIEGDEFGHSLVFLADWSKPMAI